MTCVHSGTGFSTMYHGMCTWRYRVWYRVPGTRTGWVRVHGRIMLGHDREFQLSWYQPEPGVPGLLLVERTRLYPYFLDLQQPHLAVVVASVLWNRHPRRRKFI
eukprot:SAG31_NODE_29798_length_389_cov_2.965517_1_plen_104_part_00